MTRRPTKERPPEDDRVAAFRRFEKLTKVLFGVSKEELDKKRAEYDRQTSDNREAVD